MAFLKARPEVDPERIGGLGLSTGADVLVEIAPDRSDIRAIVADGTAAETYEDWHRLRGDEAGMVPGWVMFKTMEVLSGDPPSPALEDRSAGPAAGAAGLGRHGRGVRVQRALRPRGRPERRALEPARGHPHGGDPPGGGRRTRRA